MWELINFDVDDFLANSWQKKPQLFRQALPGFTTVLSPEELAGLACEQGVHSRLVIEKDAAKPWQLSLGPFEDKVFTTLPQTHYSLLVSECEKWIPGLRQLMDCFNFIPKWRIDDLMISYAPEHGSVGPHIDEYDVFLIQANGRRKWQIQKQTAENPALIPDIDLAIMRKFDADVEWILEPGDVLYLPPKIAHHGIAVGDGCMTYSVGFRAPDVSDIMDSFLLEACNHKLTEKRYTDHSLDRNRNPSEFTQQDINHFKSMIEQMMDESDPLWSDIVGKLVSDSTLSEDIESIQCNSIEQASKYRWQQHPDSKIFYHRSENRLSVYYNGQVRSIELTKQNLECCQILCNRHEFLLSEFNNASVDSFQQLLLHLINCKTLIPVTEHD